MSLLQMSFSGSILILAIIIIRIAAIHKLPKKIFLILWEIVLLRLLIPFSIPSMFSMYSFVNQSILVPHTFTEPTVDYFFSTTPIEQPTIMHQTQKPLIDNVSSISIWFIIWCTGMILCMLFFAISYLRCWFEFQTSIPVHNEFVKQWLKEHPLKRPISIRESDKIFAPLTYGIIHPVILVPKKLDWENTQQLQYIFLHEYVHICHYDIAIKLISTFILCIHWFNPFVWVMYILFNRDIELACDESVVRQSGEMIKSSYALTLITMETKKNDLTPFCNHFSKNAIEERITAIMKIKKVSLFTIFISVILIVGVTTIFTTSAANKKQKSTTIPNTNFSDKEYAKLLALQFDGYNNMTISEYRTKVWELIDTPEYMDLLERFYQNEELYEMKDRNEIASFLFYILTPLSAEKWQTRQFGGYAASDFPHLSDNASLEYSFKLTIQNPDTLTVQEYNTARLNMVNGLQNILESKTIEQLQDETLMQETLQIDINNLIKQLESDNLQITIEYHFSPLTNLPIQDRENENENLQNIEEENPEVETRRYPNATEEDYHSLLTLKTSDYQNMSLSNFNTALLEWTNENHDNLERISEDIGWNDFQVSLNNEELSFVTLTIFLSANENVKYVQSNYNGIEEDPIYIQSFQKQKIKQNGVAWCDLYCQFSYHIKNKEKITVGERDYYVSNMKNDIQKFWNKTTLSDMLKMTESDIIKQLQKIAAKNSNIHITFAINQDQVQFESMDEKYYD